MCSIYLSRKPFLRPWCKRNIFLVNFDGLWISDKFKTYNAYSTLPDILFYFFLFNLEFVVRARSQKTSSLCTAPVPLSNSCLSSNAKQTITYLALVEQPEAGLSLITEFPTLYIIKISHNCWLVTKIEVTENGFRSCWWKRVGNIYGYD